MGQGIVGAMVPVWKHARRTLRRLGRPLLVTAAVAMLGSTPELARSVPAHAAQPSVFSDTFTGRPAEPTPWHGAG